MKNLFIIAALLLSFSAFAQRTTLTDTTYIQAAGGQYFHVQATTYADGGPGQTLVTLIGDTVAVMDYYIGKAISEAGGISAAALAVMRLKASAKLLRQWDAAVLALTGQSPLRRLQLPLEPDFLSGSWTLDNGTTLPVTITKNASGVLRYTVQGSSAKTIEVLGPDWIVLKNYPASPTDTHLFRASGNRWKTIDETLTLKK
jgi:hypothetical protein